MAQRLRAQSVYLGRAAMKGRLFHFGNYPGAVLSHRSCDVIYGDILRMPQPAATLVWLDDYEGATNLNHRCIHSLQVSDVRRGHICVPCPCEGRVFFLADVSDQTNP
jgi:hypothetical protein